MAFRSSPDCLASGDLFSYRDDKVTKSELVLFLRPTVIRGAGVGQEGLASLAAPLPVATRTAAALAPRLDGKAP